MTAQVDQDDLLERLARGVPMSGLHEDNETELFEIDDANDTMAEASHHIETIAQAGQRLHDLLARVYANSDCAGRLSWMDEAGAALTAWERCSK